MRWSLVAFVGALLCTSVVHAQNARRVRFTYLRDTPNVACPDEANMRARVVQRLGYDPFADDAESTLQARISERRAGLVAQIEMVTPGANPIAREIEARGRDCEALAESAALAISIAVDPLSFTRPVEAAAVDGGTQAEEAIAEAPPATAAAPQPTREATQEVAAPSEAAAVLAQQQSVRVEGTPVQQDTEHAPLHLWREDLSLGALLNAGLAPATTGFVRPGFALGVGIRRGSFWFPAELRMDAAGSLTDTSRGASVHTLPIVLTQRACVLSLNRFTLFACAGAQLALTVAWGSGFSANRTVVVPNVGLLVRTGVEWQASDRFALRLEGEFVGYAIRTALAVDGTDAQELWRASPWAGTIGIHGVVHFD